MNILAIKNSHKTVMSKAERPEYILLLFLLGALILFRIIFSFKFHYIWSSPVALIESPPLYKFWESVSYYADITAFALLSILSLRYQGRYRFRPVLSFFFVFFCGHLLSYGLSTEFANPPFFLMTASLSPAFSTLSGALAIPYSFRLLFFAGYLLLISATGFLLFYFLLPYLRKQIQSEPPLLFCTLLLLMGFCIANNIFTEFHSNWNRLLYYSNYDGFRIKFNLFQREYLHDYIVYPAAFLCVTAVDWLFFRIFRGRKTTGIINTSHPAVSAE